MLHNLEIDEARSFVAEIDKTYVESSLLDARLRKAVQILRKITGSPPPPTRCKNCHKLVSAMNEHTC
jgi:hypothetical protein